VESRRPADHVANHLDSLVDDALALLAVDTQNPPGRTGMAVDVVESILEPLGLETERVVADPAKPNLVATLPGDTETTLGFAGHLDTVPFDPPRWRHDPLGERDGDIVYGRGATDMKGAVASMLATARAFVETGTTPPVSVRFAFVADEEVGGDAGLPSLLEAGLDLDACVVGEATGGPERPSVTVADRGAIWLTLEATGTSAHGSRPVLGDNAIDRLYAGVQTLREEFGGRTLELDPPVDAIVEESVGYYAPTMGESTARDLFTHPSINLGTIEGGSAVNVVPERARARLDVRLAPGVYTPDLIDDIRACAAGCDGVTVAEVSWSIGTYLAPDEPVVQAVVAAARRVVDGEVHRRSATGGGDAKALRNAGVPTVEFALGTDTAHADDEYTTVDLLRANAEVYARLPAAFAATLDA